MLGSIFVSIICILAAFYLFLYRKNQYWKKKGLPTPKPSLLFGNYKDYITLKKNLGQSVASICEKFPDEPLIATYFGTEPAVIIKEPELLKIVFTKDFYYFNSRELANHTHRELFTRSIFNEANDNWRVLRQNFTPLFSSAKMKAMFHLIELNTKALIKLMEAELKISKVQEVKTFTARYTMDCIGSCVFGLETKVLENTSDDNVFKTIADDMVNFFPSRVLRAIIRQIWPNIYYSTGIEDKKTMVSEFFPALLRRVFKERNNKPGSRNDFMDYLLGFNTKKYITGTSIKGMKAKEVTNDENKVQLAVSDEMLAAQCQIFFGAGFETSSSTMSYTLYELAKKPEILQKVTEEVDGYLQKHDGNVTFECISELPFLEACVDEVLRLYPVLGAITREVIEDYTLPNGVVLEKGTRVFIPTYYMHNNPKYFPDPQQYQPERFFGKNKNNIKQYTYFPFGEGARICIGMRFARMQMYAGLVTILSKYRVELPEDQAPSVDFQPMSFITQPVTPIRIRFLER